MLRKIPYAELRLANRNIRSSNLYSHSLTTLRHALAKLDDGLCVTPYEIDWIGRAHLKARAREIADPFRHRCAFERSPRAVRHDEVEAPDPSDFRALLQQLRG